MPRFGKDKDSARKEELDRQAAEEVERLTRRGGPPGMGGGMGGGMPGMPGMGQLGMPSPLERIAEEVRDAPRPSMRKQAPARKAAARPQPGFTPLPSGAVGSSFGPGGLNPGPRMGGTAPPPPAFGGGDYDEDFGGHVTGPPVFNAEPDEDEEMSITEMALMDHAARRGYDPEDLVIRYDAGTAQEMRDAAMRQFYERQQSRRPGAGTNNPFAPAGMRGGGPAGPAVRSRADDDPAAAGGALAQRLANKRRREAEEARRAQAAAEPAPPSPSARTETPQTKAEPADDGGALARAMARRRRALGMDRPSPLAQMESPPAQMEPEPQPEGEVEPSAPRLRAVPLEPVAGEDTPSREETTTPTRRPATRTAKKAVTRKAPAAKKAAKAAATPTKARKAPAAAKAKKVGASLAKAPATKKAAAARKVGKARTVFCIECGEKNPAIAKFCFNCGTRLAAPEN